MATLEKTFPCLSCGEQIKLERKPDNSGWLRYNLDGTKHLDVVRKKSSPIHTSISTNPASGGQKLGEELKASRDLLIAVTRRIDAIIIEKKR